MIPSASRGMSMWRGACRVRITIIVRTDSILCLYVQELRIPLLYWLFLFYCAAGSCAVPPASLALAAVLHARPRRVAGAAERATHTP
jgi:hypothetical protein